MVNLPLFTGFYTFQVFPGGCLGFLNHQQYIPSISSWNNQLILTIDTKFLGHPSRFNNYTLRVLSMCGSHCRRHTIKQIEDEITHRQPRLPEFLAPSSWKREVSHEKNPYCFPCNTGWLIGILIMVYYNPYITGEYSPPLYTLNNLVFFSWLRWYYLNPPKTHAQNIGRKHLESKQMLVDILDFGRSIYKWKKTYSADFGLKTLTKKRKDNHAVLGVLKWGW